MLLYLVLLSVQGNFESIEVFLLLAGHLNALVLEQTRHDRAQLERNRFYYGFEFLLDVRDAFNQGLLCHLIV